MNKPANNSSEQRVVSSEQPSSQTPSVVRAFTALDVARADLTRLAADVRTHRNALRRWARAQGYRISEARWRQRAVDQAAWEARVKAESAHRSALSHFRAVAMLAALERLVDTDRRLNAA